MVRKGIYVNGKEIVARYVGDKLVWKKQVEKLIGHGRTTNSKSLVTSRYFVNQVVNFAMVPQKRTYYNVTIACSGETLPYKARQVTFSNGLASITFYNSEGFNSFINESKYAVPIAFYAEE